jgi:hypothetical protein
MSLSQRSTAALRNRSVTHVTQGDASVGKAREFLTGVTGFTFGHDDMRNSGVGEGARSRQSRWSPT